jgi:predicted DNA-binding transcriptional regulator AlpA
MPAPEQIANLAIAIERLTIAVSDLQAKRAVTVRLLSASTIAQILDVSESSILKGWKDGTFPPPDHKLFGGKKGWRWDVHQIEMFIASTTPEGRERMKTHGELKLYTTMRKKKAI